MDTQNDSIWKTHISPFKHGNFGVSMLDFRGHRSIERNNLYEWLMFSLLEECHHVISWWAMENPVINGVK